MRRVNRFHEIVRAMVNVSNIPITAKIRTGISETKSTAHSLVTKMKTWDLALTTVSYHVVICMLTVVIVYVLYTFVCMLL